MTGRKGMKRGHSPVYNHQLKHWYCSCGILLMSSYAKDKSRTPTNQEEARDAMYEHISNLGSDNGTNTSDSE